MENNNFKSFKYVVGNDFIYKDKVVVKVFFIHDYKNFLRTIDIKKKNGANDSYYIAEAKKIVKQELDSGKLLKASKRCVNAFAKGLAITTAVVVGISAVGTGGFYTYKYITETQQHNLMQTVIDEVNALNENSTLAEITKAKEDYDKLSDALKEQLPEGTKKHLDEQIALYQKDANAADKFENDAAELDGVTDSKKEIDSIVAQENALTTRAKTLIKAETFTKVTQAVQAYKEEEKKLNEALKLVNSLNETSSEDDIKVAAKAITDVGRTTQRPDFIEKAEAAQKTVREQLKKYKEDEITVKKFEALVEAALHPTSTRQDIDKARQQKELADKVVRTNLLERIKIADANFVKADEAYKKDAARFEEFKKIAGNLSDKSSNAEIKRAEDAIVTVKDIQHRDLLIEINKITANIEQQRVAYDRDKKDVDDAKTVISALAAKIRTCTKVEIDEGNKNLAEAVAINNRRQGDFKDTIDAMAQSMEEIESEYAKDEAAVQEFTEKVIHLSKNQTTCTDSDIKDMEKRADEIKTNVTRPDPDFAKAIDDGTKTIQAVRALYTEDKKKVDDFAAFAEKLDGITDTEEDIEEGYVLMQAAKDINRDDLKEKLDDAKEKYQIAADNFLNDQNAAKAVVKLISDIETEPDLVLDEAYITSISNSYDDLGNDRSKEMADDESTAKWGKNINNKIVELELALLNGTEINEKLFGLPGEASSYDTNQKFKLLSIAALYDNLDVPTKKVITLANRSKLALRSEINLNNAYSFTSLNGIGIAADTQEMFWNDDYGYYVKGTLTDSNEAQILSLDASAASELKTKFSSIKFCARVADNGTETAQTLSIKSNGTVAKQFTLEETFSLFDVSTDLLADGELEFIINNSNSKSFGLTFLYGVPKNK